MEIKDSGTAVLTNGHRKMQIISQHLDRVLVAITDPDWKQAAFFSLEPDDMEALGRHLTRQAALLRHRRDNVIAMRTRKKEKS